MKTVEKTAHKEAVCVGRGTLLKTKLFLFFYKGRPRLWFWAQPINRANVQLNLRCFSANLFVQISDTADHCLDFYTFQFYFQINLVNLVIRHGSVHSTSYP